MTNPKPADAATRAREILAGYPEPVVTAATDFLTTRSPEALDRLVFGVLAFHLPKKEDRQSDLSARPGFTRLAADLSFDSLSLVEVNFLLTDLLGAKLSDDELRSLVTLDDLRLLLRRHLLAGAAP